MSHPAELIRDAAAAGDFIRAAELWQKHASEFDRVRLSELIAAVGQSAAQVRSRKWVAEAYRPNRPKRP